MSDIPIDQDANHESLHHSCLNPMACLICCRGVQHTEPTPFTVADLLEALKPKHTIAVSSEEMAERIRAALDEAGLRATVVVNSILDEGQAIVMRDPGPVPVDGISIQRWVCESPGLAPCTEEGNIRYSLRHSKCGLR